MENWGFREWADLATASGVVVAAISLVVGVIGAWINARNDRREKQARAFEVIHERYQKMADKRRDLAARTDANRQSLMRKPTTSSRATGPCKSTCGSITASV